MLRALIFLLCGIGFLALLAKHWAEEPEEMRKGEIPKISESLSQRAHR